MFVQADASSTALLPGSFPHRTQLELKYWQRRTNSPTATEIFSKELVEGLLRLREFHRPPSTLRGHEYDMRVTFIPVDWMGVLNQFARATAARMRAGSRWKPAFCRESHSPCEPMPSLAAALYPMYAAALCPCTSININVRPLLRRH